ncbi:MAG: hypothetical protein K9K66_17960 [Desulfarculaceae bacterium]|nr:hypothetical protein [Desulfarculaceae bacterium]MCF8074354.1 hypothetical protein [Desulfarculaceae bacterium]MCF8103546.1 hypothetical protein [Desulfarculaceae bacterium]MCF8117313.1 hypothetical protein [Desulfarculaceae bacterium]
MSWRAGLALVVALGLLLVGACSDQSTQATGKAKEKKTASSEAVASPPPQPTPPAPPPQPLATGPADQEPAKYLELARSALGLNQNRKALGLAEQAAQAIWQRVPLSLARAVLVKEPAKGYGIYQPREDGVYLVSGPDQPVFPGKGMPVYVYLEPVGYRVERKAGGEHTFGLAMDVSLYDAMGKHLFSKKDFMKEEVSSHRFRLEHFLNVIVSLKGAPPGKYKLQLTVKDLVGQQKATVELPIELALAPAGDKPAQAE